MACTIFYLVSFLFLVFPGDFGNEALRRDMLDLRLQLDRERRLRMHLEEKLRSVESQMYSSDRLRDIAQHVQPTYQSHEVRAKNPTPYVTHVGPIVLTIFLIAFNFLFIFFTEYTSNRTQWQP